jgi:hypothetical protein
MGLYSKYSDIVTEIIKEDVPLYEKTSIDEFYIDLSGMEKFFGSYKLATELRQRITRETNLPISFALSANKTVSKVGTGEAKPTGQKQIPFGTGARARMFRTAEEVLQAGLSLEWGSEARAAEVLGVRFWVPQPEGVDAPHVFTLEGPEGYGAIVKFFAARTTYGTVGKTLISASQTFLRKDRGGLPSGVWEMTATKEAKNGNTWLLPRLKPAGKTSPDLAAFLKSLGV